MKCLVTGAGGQLGRAVGDEIRRRGDLVVGLGHRELAVEDRDAVQACFDEHRPDAVVHCAAWTDVDGCEADPAKADRINGAGTANIAAASREIGARLAHVSTDFVFDGTKREPYRVGDPTGPLSAYGRSKLLGERAVLEGQGEACYVVRTAWVFGPGGSNFPRAILDRARSGQPLRVVDDQTGSPTMTRDLAEALLDLLHSGAPGGVYHATNEGSCSWHRFATEILATAGLSAVDVGTMSSAELARPAPRPAYSVLDCSGLAAVRGRSMPSYQDGLRRYMTEESERVS